MASISKAKLVEQATKLGIKDAKDISYRKLEALVREAKKSKVPSTAAVSKKNKNASTTTTTHSVPPFKTTTMHYSHRGLRIEIYRDMASLWRWRAVAANGDIVADSGEGYMTKWGTKRAVRRILGL